MGGKKSDVEKKKGGNFSKILTVSKVPSSVWLASSFYKRMSSVANQEVTKESSSLFPDKVGVLATLRVNREIAQLMREFGGHL